MKVSGNGQHIVFPASAGVFPVLTDTTVLSPRLPRLGGGVSLRATRNSQILIRIWAIKNAPTAASDSHLPLFLNHLAAKQATR